MSINIATKAKIIRKIGEKISFKKLLTISPLPRQETEILLAWLLKKPREYLLSHPETPITPSLQKKFRALANKRQKNYPLAYLIDHKEFYGLEFKVSPKVLIPRPETELIVDEIIKLAKNKAQDIVDLGTGSGAIIISAAQEIKKAKPKIYKKSNFLAVDISAAALKIAKENARRHRLDSKIKFFSGNLLLPLLPLMSQIKHERSTIIAANLPYLSPAQIKASPSIWREPRLALESGPDGLRHYRELFKQLSTLRPPHAEMTLLCEIDPKQAEKISQILRKNWPTAKIIVKKDLAGHKRLINAQLK